MRFRIFLNYFFLASVLSISSAFSQNSILNAPIKLTLLHTNDIHTHLKQEPSTGEKNPYSLGGVARLKTLVDKLRSENPNSLLLDGGDWSEGIAYYYVDAGSNILKIMSEIGYDAAVAGNHDFLNGPLEIAKAVERANPSFPVLGANKNLFDSALDPHRDFINKNILDYKIVNKNGIKIALIGVLCIDFTYKEYFKPGKITDPLDQIKTLTEKLRKEKQADIIILLSHNTFETNVKWAQKIPYVNVIISGHSHHKTPEPVIVRNNRTKRPAFIVETGEWGQFLGKMNLKYYPHLKLLTLKDYELLPVHESIFENKKIKSMVEEQDAILENKFGNGFFHETVTNLEHEAIHHDYRETILGNLSADAMKETAQTDAALEINSLIGVGIPAGPVTPYQIFNIQPHIFQPLAGSQEPFPNKGKSWTVHKAKLTGWQIKLLINAYLRVNSFAPEMGWLSVSGMKVLYSNKLFNSIFTKIDDPYVESLFPIQSLKIFNQSTRRYEETQPFKNYTVAIHDGLVMSLKVIKDITKLPLDLGAIEDTGIQVTESVSKMATKNSTIRIPDFAPLNRYQTDEKDLAIHTHNISYSNQTIFVTIQNEGSQPTDAFDNIQIFRSKVNDPVNDNTQDFESIPIYSQFIPKLNPGSSVTITFKVTRDEFPEAGVYSTEFKLNSKNDGYSTNNSTKKHFKIIF